ncbi:MAG: glycoside hydrolase family 66 protein, partial [Bacillota bacterium]
MRRTPLVVLLLLLTLAAAGFGALPGARVTAIAPIQGMVKPGQPARFVVDVNRPWYDPRPVTVRITRGLSVEPVATLTTRGSTVEWTPPAPGGYGVTAALGKYRASTAIDVGDDWTKRPRYGFLSDFGPQDAGQADRFGAMARYHLNGLQFYDWMYRHSDYLPPAEEFVDPLGRTLSRKVIQEKMALARQHGMAAMAYTAIYGAPREFFEQHREWALYTPAGHPITFGDGFLYIMNPEKGSPWFDHMVSEYGKIVREMGFDGIHLDQYGDPKSGFRYPGRGAKVVDIATAITHLIDATKAEIGPDKATVFNDVGGWPLADTAPTTNDFVYIEVWPPHVNFEHLAELIRQGRRLSGGKPVVLAAYIDPAYEPSVLLTDAAIFANGGYHIELGEGNAMLADPYFPKYKPMSPELAEHLRRYYDVAVRYQDLLYGPDLKPWETEVT